MATILVIVALIPAAYAALVAGDFSQMIYKPSRRQVYGVVSRRREFIGATLLLWLAGLAIHLLGSPTAPWLLLATGLLAMTFLLVGFFMAGYLMFPVVRQPEFMPATEANSRLKPDDMVIGVAINGEARAYPLKWIARPHVVEDTVGGVPLNVTYCLLSNSSLTFEATEDGQRTQFIVPLQWENNLMLYDPQKKRLIQQINGEIMGGPNAGRHLPQVPSRILPWHEWQAEYPQTQVWDYRPGDLFAPLMRAMLKMIRQQNEERSAPFFPTITRFDPRLPNKAQVLGVETEDASRAYGLDYLEQHPVLNDEVGETPLLVAYDSEQGAAAIYDRRNNGQVLTFQPAVDGDKAAFVDAETGSTWDQTGQAVAGPLKGTALSPVNHLSRVLWFSWFNFYPQTELSG